MTGDRSTDMCVANPSSAGVRLKLPHASCICRKCAAVLGGWVQSKSCRVPNASCSKEWASVGHFMTRQQGQGMDALCPLWPNGLVLAGKALLKNTRTAHLWPPTTTPV